MFNFAEEVLCVMGDNLLRRGRVFEDEQSVPREAGHVFNIWLDVVKFEDCRVGKP